MLNSCNKEQGFVICPRVEYFCTLNTPVLFIKTFSKVQDVIHPRKRSLREPSDTPALVRDPMRWIT